MMAIVTLETQARNHAYPYRGKVVPVAPSVALSLSFSDITPDPLAALTWQFTVIRSGDRTSEISVAWAVVPSGSPMPAGTFVGGVYPTGTATVPAGETSAPASFQTAAGGQPSVDQFATLALTNPSGCTLGAPASVQLRLPGKPIPAQDQLSVTCPDTSWPVSPAAGDHLVTVVRSNSLGTYLAGTQVRVRLTGTGGNPIVAADISGGLLDSTVTFLAGETSRPFTVSTLPGSAPASDKTGRVAVSAPVGGQLAATGTFVDVAIPHSIVLPPVGILPPQYTDPNFTGMSAYDLGGSPGVNDVKAALAALSGKAACKTTYVELPSGFSFGTAVFALPYKGYVDPTSKKIYPLILCSQRGKIGSRTPADIAALAHFRFLTMNTAQWLWLYGLALEQPLVSGGHDYVGDGIDPNGSTDCFITRCYFDGSYAIHSDDTHTRLRVGACDLANTPPGTLERSVMVFEFGGNSLTSQSRPIAFLVYQCYLGNVRAPAAADDHGTHFYMAAGVAPLKASYPNYPDQPFDLNARDSWFFNNLIYSTKKYLVYIKHNINIWRNRVVSTAIWNEPDDGTPGGKAFHYISNRGGNNLGKPIDAAPPDDHTASVCYNSTEGKSGHNNMQGWWLTAEFNDWGHVPTEIYMQCDRLTDNPDNPAKHAKTLLATSHARLRANKNGAYQMGTARPDVGYKYFKPMLDNIWEGEGDGDASASSSWNWADSADGITYDRSGDPVVFDATTGLNTQVLKMTFPGDTAKVACAAGQLKKVAATAAVRKLTTAHKDADYTGEFTKGKKGIVAKDASCLTWDYVGKGAGDGGGDGGGGGTEPTNYDLISDNMTVWWPSDDMPADYPNSSVTFIAGGGLEIKAQATPAPHACINVWHKKRPPDGDCVFTFYATMLDALGQSDATADGIFALLRVRQKGSDGFPADPNSWTTAQYRPVTPYAYLTPGSDNMVRDRTSGYRHSFANHANTLGASMQFRCRPSDGGNDGKDDSTQLTPTVPGTVPTTGDSFLFVKDQKYKLVYTRVGTTCTCVKTKVSDGTTQTWTFVDAKLGPLGQGVGGWCGFYSSLGRWIRIEPVPGVPFCAAA